MKKILSVFMAVILFASPAYAVSQWAIGEPAGTQNASDIDALVGVNNDALDRILIKYRKDCTVRPSSVSTISVGAGEIAIPNAAGSVVRWRRNTSTTSVTWSDIDTGAEASSTQYYVYVLADADAATFTVKMSTSSSAPSGATYYRKIGFFYNDSSGNITSVGNLDGAWGISKATGTSDITTTSTSYADMDDMTVQYVASGLRPVRISYNAPMTHASGGQLVYVTFDVDGTDVRTTVVEPSDNLFPQSVVLDYVDDSLSYFTAGAHTVKVQWKIVNGTAHQKGSTWGARTLTVEEI